MGIFICRFLSVGGEAAPLAAAVFASRTGWSSAGVFSDACTCSSSDGHLSHSGTSLRTGGPPLAAPLAAAVFAQRTFHRAFFSFQPLAAAAEGLLKGVFQSQACEHGQVEEHLRLMSLRMMMANTSLVWMQAQVLKVGSVIPMSTISSQSHTTSFVLS